MKLMKILAAALGFGLIAALAGSFTPPAASASGSAPVTVVNTPLPVQGSVSVNNFPASQSVSGTVNVGNFPTVQPVSFSNTNQSPLFVQNVENPARTGFQASTDCAFNSGLCRPSSPIYTVPAGQIAVIEYASGSCVVDSGTTITIVNVGWSQASGETAFNLIPGQAISASAGTVVSFGQQVRAYVFGGPSGNSLVFQAGANAAENQSDFCFLSLGGHTVEQ